MTSTLFILQIILAILITISVLLQKSSSIGLGAYSGSNESLFGAKGPMGFLAKVTFVLGTALIVNTLILSYMYTKESNRSVADTIVPSTPATPASAPIAPSAPAAPANSIPQAN
ncbi:MAG: preprotein translocase subunit SecG [Sulfurovaceae bacterium]|nr:preprotein translocase subunit SecG [Sulfurovaceae bacterium]